MRRRREHRIAELFKIFSNVMGAEFMGFDKWEGESLEDDLAISMVIGRLRVVLGTEEVSEMRAALVSQALANLRRHS